MERQTHNWADTEFVRKHMDMACQYMAESLKDFWGRWYACSSMDSPLEVAFAIWWRALLAAGEISESVASFEAQTEVVTSEGRRYRLDFVLTPGWEMKLRAERAGVPYARLCVELDGHDFHERTKEQVAYRNQRDRDLQLDGWTVLHFSGSELHREPWKVVTEAFNQAYRLFGWELLERPVQEAEWLAAERAAGNQAGALTTQES